MLSVLIQVQCPSLEISFSEKGSFLRISLSPLLVLYHQPLRKSNTLYSGFYMVCPQKNSVQILALLLTGV